MLKHREDRFYFNCFIIYNEIMGNVNNYARYLEKALFLIDKGYVIDKSIAELIKMLEKNDEKLIVPKLKKDV